MQKINQSFRRLSKLIRYQYEVPKNIIDSIRIQTPAKQYPTFQPIIKEQKSNPTQIITDDQFKLRFLVEKTGFPGCADLGICINLGTQDQNNKNAGSLFYLKNYVHIKQSWEETIENYDFYQQSGAAFTMDYDHTFTYIKSSFFPEDVSVMLDLLLDLALKEKKMLQDNSEMQSLGTQIVDLTRQTAFGHAGLGMPKEGVGNILTNNQFLKFQKNITPSNTLFTIANYPNQDELIQLIKTKIKNKYNEFLLRPPFKRIQSKYLGGYQTYSNESQDFFEFAIAYESCQLDSPYMEMMNILKTLLGNASSFSSGGPGKGMHSRCTKNLLNSVPCVQKASCINQHYLNTGIFGLTVGGPHSDTKQVIECTINELKKLRYPISNDELERAKNILIASIYSNIERQTDRLEQMGKHIFAYEKVRLYEYERNIRAVTSEMIRNYIIEMMKKKPTLVLSGNAYSIKNCMSEKEILKKINNYF